MGKIAEDEKVDFVILWVDGNDPEWQATSAISAEKRIYGNIFRGGFSSCVST